MNEIIQTEPETEERISEATELTVQQERAVAPTASPAIADGPGALLSAIMQLAANPAVDVEKFERLLAMQERMEAKQAEREFNTALHLAQQEMPRVQKNGTIRLVKDGVDKGSIPFAKWEDVDAALRPIMTKHGFSLSFDTTQREGGGAVITGMLRHVAGHQKASSIGLALDTGAGRNNNQAMGSTISYGKRYIAEMLFNIVREGTDDDGKLGGQKTVKEEDADLLRQALLEAGFETNESIAKFLKPHTNYGATAPEEVMADDFTRLMNLATAIKRRNDKKSAKQDDAA